MARGASTAGHWLWGHLPTREGGEGPRFLILALVFCLDASEVSVGFSLLSQRCPPIACLRDTPIASPLGTCPVPCRSEPLAGDGWWAP